MYLAILVSSGLVVAAAFTTLIAFRFGAPLLLIFLCVGLIAGEDGLGLEFDDARLAYFLGSLALAIILFDSGFGTKFSAFRSAAAPAIVMATLGVILTMAILGLAVKLVFGFSWAESFLLGAIVSSTDAAAVFFLLRVGGIHLRDHVRSTLEIESGSNDPMAIFLTVTLIAIIGAGSSAEGTVMAFGVGFFREMVLGIVFGLGGGYLIVRIVNRLDLETGLTPVLVLAIALVLFGITGALHGSGFLAVYVAGIYCGNQTLRSALALRRFQDGMTWFAQIAMFLVFGLLATPSEFRFIAFEGVLLALFLIFVARPVAIWLCLLPFRFAHDETAFIAWVGLRGAVSLLLAIMPLAEGLPNGQLIFNTAFIVVLVSLLVQGWTVKPMARQLSLIIPPDIGPIEKVELDLPGTAHHELISYRVVPDSPVARGERIPRWARPSLVIRDGRSMRPQYAGRIVAGDLVYLFTAPRNTRLLDRLFASPAHLADDDKDFFGEFVLDARQPLGELAQAYGFPVPDAPDRPISAYLLDRLGGRAEIGDRVAIGPVELIVRELDDTGGVRTAGLALSPAPTAPAAWPVLQSASVLIAVVRRTLRRMGLISSG
jgi:cell volume regulation protein A